MEEHVDDSIKLTGCAHCGEKRPTNRCPCRSQYYCNKTCQRRDWRRHKQDCRLFLEAGEVPEPQDLIAWTDAFGAEAFSRLVDELGLSIPSNRAKLFGTVIVVLIKFHPRQPSLRNRFSYSGYQLHKILDMLSDPVEIDGSSYGLQQVARDVLAPKGQQPARVVGKSVHALYISSFQPGTQQATFTSHLSHFQFSANDGTFESFTVHPDNPEKTQRLKHENPDGGHPLGLDLRAWATVKQGELMEIVVQDMNLFGDANPSAANESACILNLEYVESALNIKDRFVISRFVGCYSLAN